MTGKASQSKEPAALVRRSGVTVALYGDDRGTERTARGSPGRRVDTIGALLASGHIDEAQADAGWEFQRQFNRAMASRSVGIGAAVPDGMPPRDSGGWYGEGRWRGSQSAEKVRRSLQAVGGTGSPGGRVLWYVVGEGWSLRAFAEGLGWGGSGARDWRTVRGVLVAALGVLAAEKGKRHG